MAKTEILLILRTDQYSAHQVKAGRFLEFSSDHIRARCAQRPREARALSWLADADQEAEQDEAADLDRDACRDGLDGCFDHRCPSVPM